MSAWCVWGLGDSFGYLNKYSDKRYEVLAVQCNFAEIEIVKAAEIVQVILDHGKLRPPDVLSSLRVSDTKSMSLRSFSVMCTKNSLENSLYDQTFHKLVSGSYLKPSTILSHWSPQDRLMQYEAEEKRKITGFPTAKELRQAKEIAEIRLRREAEDEEQTGLVNTLFDFQ